MMSLLPARLNRDIRWHGCTVIDWFGIIYNVDGRGNGGWNVHPPSIYLVVGILTKNGMLR